LPARNSNNGKNGPFLAPQKFKAESMGNNMAGAHPYCTALQYILVLHKAFQLTMDNEPPERQMAMVNEMNCGPYLVSYFTLF
jgi:hypothetical protein